LKSLLKFVKSTEQSLADMSLSEFEKILSPALFYTLKNHATLNAQMQLMQHFCMVVFAISYSSTTSQAFQTYSAPK